MGGGGGTSITLDLGDDGGNESTALSEIATDRDRFGVFTEPSANKLLIDVESIYEGYVKGPPASPGTYDCEFDGSIGSWTVVEGSLGTINPTHTSGTIEVYDLTTRPGWVLMQAGRTTTENILLRADVTLADGEGVYTRMALGRQGSNTGNELWVGISVNDDDSYFAAGNEAFLMVDTEPAGAATYTWRTGSVIGSLQDGGTIGVVDLAITRTGTHYYAWVSANSGAVWSPLGRVDLSANIPDNVWLFFDSFDVGATHVTPVVGFDWVRFGSDNPYAPGW